MLITWVTYTPAGSVYSSGSDLIIRGTYSCDLDVGTETTVDADFS